jgi:hypothetical protein
MTNDEWRRVLCSLLSASSVVFRRPNEARRRQCNAALPFPDRLKAGLQNPEGRSASGIDDRR